MPSPEPRPSSDFRPTGPIRGVPTTNPGAGGIPLEGSERASSATNQFQGMASPKNGYAAATSTSLRGVAELRIADISEIQRNLDGGPGPRQVAVVPLFLVRSGFGDTRVEVKQTLEKIRYDRCS